MMTQKSVKLLKLLSLLALLFAFNFLNKSLIHSFTQPAEESEFNVNRKSFDPDIFKIISFGQLPSALDWIWINALADPSLAHTPKGLHSPLFYRFELITHIDPAFLEAGYAGGILLAVVRKESDGAIEILKRSEHFRQEQLPYYPPLFRERFWSHSWKIPMLLGYLYLFELNDLQLASQAFSAASTVPGAPEFTGQLSTRLQKPGGFFDVGLRVLNLMIASAASDSLKEELTKKRDALLKEQALHELQKGKRK